MDTPFHASANMRLAVDAIRRLCPTAGIRAVNLLARTRKGTYRGRRNGRPYPGTQRGSPPVWTRRSGRDAYTRA